MRGELEALLSGRSTGSADMDDDDGATVETRSSVQKDTRNLSR